MNSSSLPNSTIDLYLHLNKQFYFAGELVEGIVSINANDDAHYEKLVLKLWGEEHWTDMERFWKHEEDYHSYDSMFTLTHFQSHVKKGQYTCPFSFVLPASMSGSFTDSPHCYIQYTLRAVLVHPTSHLSLFSDLKMNIMEPFRTEPATITDTATAHINTCHCLIDGVVTIHVASDNVVVLGEEIKVNGIVDNSGGWSAVDRVDVNFEEWRVTASTAGYATYHHHQIHCLHEMGEVEPGQVEHFSIKVKTPQWNSYTAIGRVVGRYFLVRVVPYIGNKRVYPLALVHVVANTNHPSILQHKKNQLPDEWNPEQLSTGEFHQMSPFYYQPLPQVRATNREISSSIQDNSHIPLPFAPTMNTKVEGLNRIKQIKGEESVKSTHQVSEEGGNECESSRNLNH